ncbi:delta 9-fatty acid desaturase protein [Phellopilus nigrolimitatus]|nr:delta 9-fatty acid desaturase protein [Phellopilus nigrolimitatus]
MSDVPKPSLKTPPPEMAAISPPTSPRLDGRKTKERKEKKEEEPADINIPDNYVSWTLRNAKPRDPISWNNIFQELNYLSLAVLVITPSIAIWGLCSVPLMWKTGVFAVLYYFFTGLGITAGYHRLWAHRSYNASRPLEYFLAAAGTGAVEGSIKWWCRGHRAHHRYTDTELDPYNAHKGFWWSHIGWMLVKPRFKPGVADISDLSKSVVVRWQHRWYVPLILMMGFGIPTLIPGLLWGDFLGGFVFAGAARLSFVHHSTFCVNSLAHWLGETPFDDKHTPRDHMVTAFVTIGEGYHNFHHQFPMDYRNAIKWYQYDPTKWFIWVCSKFNLASHLKSFPDNEVRKGQLTMQLKKLRATQEKIAWPVDNDDLPVVSWETFLKQAEKRPLIVVAGFIHDMTSFMDQHPGGRHLLAKNIGRDATTAFFGGVYDHSNAAHNLLAMKRKLRVARYNEMSSPYNSSTAVSDSEGLLGL